MTQRRALFILILFLGAASFRTRPCAGDDLFRERVAPIFQRRCLSCHNSTDRKAGLSLEQQASALAGGDSGPVIFPGDVDSSYLVELITPVDGHAKMPKDADPLSPREIEAIRDWITSGAVWPEGFVVEPARVADTNWWSLEPLARPTIPALAAEDQAWVRNSIDAFVLAKLREKGLAPSPEADRRTLIRRLYFDLTGLPPSPDEINTFVNDTDPRAYERLVDRLLESPQYGERWARHWLDVVHYGDTHGYDKDKPRPNSWPYRDYVIRSFNTDKPYARFVREQIAGDILFPDDADGIVATGFVAAGPWDFISHVEVPESKIDGQIARSLDRDDMVRTTLETFDSVTIGCARCHNHKFDPYTQHDYYSLQAVFAAVDRADRPVDADPNIAHKRRELVQQREVLAASKKVIDDRVQKKIGSELAKLNEQFAELDIRAAAGAKPEFGYHSQIEAAQDATKWVQVDLGVSAPLDQITIVGCHDDFNQIGAGFGFPVRYKIEISDDAQFSQAVTAVVDFTEQDVPNPGVVPQVFSAGGKTARYVRITATKLAPRQNDFIFALAELTALTADGKNLAASAEVTALDSIEAPVRWRKTNLVDGYYYGVQVDATQMAHREELKAARATLMAQALSDDERRETAQIAEQLQQLAEEIGRLPPPELVYAAATHFATEANFQPTLGKPREIHLLHRGNITQPGEIVEPGVLAAIHDLSAPFHLDSSTSEGERRAALANWIVDTRHPLTWRSIVNRIWLYHFGHGIVDSPNDFGRMGQRPTHPELLDWLAVEFRDGGQSLKALHRLICNSATYRQSSAHNEQAAAIDSANQFLWRMNRRRLEAEAIRDSVLFVAGKLDRSMYGPGFQDFVIDKPAHSPHYEYGLHDPEDPKAHRRSVYRFIVRSQQQPFMTTLDCADPSMQVEKRNETVTALQALTLLNNRFMLAMSKHFAARVTAQETSQPAQVMTAFRLAIGRDPTDTEQQQLVSYAQQYGLPNLCRVIFNLNEFVFVD